MSMGAFYSPFFTSGFLSGSSGASTSASSCHSSYLHYHPNDYTEASVHFTDSSSYLSLAMTSSISFEEHGDGISCKVTPRQSLESLRVLPPPIMPACRTPSPGLRPNPSSFRRSHRPSDSVLSAEPSPSPQQAPTRRRTLSLTCAKESSFNRATMLAETLASLEGLARDSFFDDDDLDDYDDDDDDDDEEEEVFEPEDVVLPASDWPLRSSLFALSAGTIQPISGKEGLHQWLPLTSFVDLTSESHPHDEDRWNWRSFIEVGVM